MGLFDKPLHELREYQGINPRPHDFDPFWDRSLDEMRAVDAAADFVPYQGLRTTNAECFDLYFTGVDGARIHAKYVRPKAPSAPCPAILQFHGYTQNSGGWLEKLAWVNEGFCVAAMDCRGQGGLSEDPGGTKGNTHHGHIIRGLDDSPEQLLFRKIFLDTAKLAEVVMARPEVDAERVCAMGGSQGGGLTLACAALEPRIRKAAPMYPFLSDYLRVWEMDLAKNAYAELTTYFRLFDPRHERREEIFTRLGYIDIQHLAPRIEAEVLMFTGLMDTICPPSTQFAAYNKIGSPKEVLIYPDFAHETVPGYGDLVLNFFADLLAPSA